MCSQGTSFCLGDGDPKICSGENSQLVSDSALSIAQPGSARLTELHCALPDLLLLAVDS